MANNYKIIDSTVAKMIRGHRFRPQEIAAFEDAIKRVSSAQPERKKGHYIGEADGYADGELVYDIWSCSECGCYFEDWDEQPTYNFCPNCGADMRTPTQVQLDEADDVMMGEDNGKTD